MYLFTIKRKHEKTKNQTNRKVKAIAKGKEMVGRFAVAFEIFSKDIKIKTKTIL